MSLPTLPVFWTRADGGITAGVPNLGTASGAGQIIVKSAGNATGFTLQEAVNSPQFERAEQGTVTKSFKDIPWEDSCTYMAGLGRGTIQVDNSHPELGSPFIFRVLSSNQQHEQADGASITIVSESLSFDTPPDEFQVVPIELGVDILRHPRYRFALDPTIADGSNTVTFGNLNNTVSISSIKQAIIRAIQTYRDSPFFPSSDNLNGLIQNNVVNQFNDTTINVPYLNDLFDEGAAEENPIFWDGNDSVPSTNCRYFIIAISTNEPVVQFALAAAGEIIQKLWRMEDTPLLTGFEVTWSAYYVRPPDLNPGSYVENPMTQANPALPDYFWAPDGLITWVPPREGSPTPQGGGGEASIFDAMASINPSCYSDDGTESGSVDISWLRKSDEFEFNRCWFRVTRKWLGAPIGHWDSDLYNTSNRPSISTFTNDPPLGYRPLNP